MSNWRQGASALPSDDVGAALHLLRDALAEEAARINEEGAKAMTAADYPTAEGVIDFAKRLLAFRSKVEALGGEWSELEGLQNSSPRQVREIVSKRFFGRARGEITPQSEFHRPLLEALVQLGGSATTAEATDKVGEIMKDRLKQRDFEILPSSRDQIRWRNAVAWARNDMVNKDGRMRSGSPNGIWEISDKGRDWLRDQPRGTG